MKFSTKTIALTVIAAGAVALPATAASAAGINTAVRSVQLHTDRADSALDRAVALYEKNAKNADRSARRAYATSRKEMGIAKSSAARARRLADSPTDQVKAAKAQELVADQLDQNIKQLAGIMPEAPARDESKIASAARADTKSREKAIGVLTALLVKVPEQARTAIAKALAQLSTNRGSEAKTEARTLTSKHVSNKNKRRLMSALRTSVDGQVSASQTLALLIASTDMPAESKQGLQTAYDNVTAEHGSIVDILSRFSDRMPAFARTFVEGIITQARTDAQGMRENHPTGPPAGIPGAPPSGTPGGPPSTIPGPPIG